MGSIVINNRADLDAVAGTPAHDQFMAQLAGSLYRLERDDTKQAWVAVEDTSTIERFSFLRSDFAQITAPEIPAYIPVDNNVKKISKLKFVEWCETNNRLTDLQTLLDSDTILNFKWQAASELDINNPLVIEAANALGLDAQETFNIAGQALI